LFLWNKDGTVYISQQAPSSTFSAVTLPTIVNGRCNAGILHWWNGLCSIVHENDEQITIFFLKDEDKKFDQHHQPTMVEWTFSQVL